MKNNVQIFENAEFGMVRTLTISDEPWFVGRDVANILGYAKPENAIANHVDDEDKTSTLIQGSGSNYKSKAVIINESGLYSLILSSKLPAAKAFKRWVTSDILPTIRKTGSYSSTPATDLKAKRLQIMGQNAKVREAKLWEKLAQTTDNATYKQICTAYAANTLAGKQVLALPEAQQRTYTATEIAEMLGVTAQKIGRLANLHDMKVEEYGKWFCDKSRYSNKEVEVFRYYENAIPAFKALLKGGEAE